MFEFLNKKGDIAQAGVAQWIERGLGTKGSLVGFPVRAHAWVVGQVPSGGHVRGNHTLMFLSLLFSLKLNKILKSEFKNYFEQWKNILIGVLHKTEGT